MKKKLIESMPAPKYKKGKEKYIAIARMPADGLCTIDYIDTEEDTIEVRLCLTKKEWMNYYPKEGKWDCKGWTSVCPDVPMHDIEIKNKTYVKRIIGSYHSIAAYQSDISWRIQQKKLLKRKKELKNRCERIPELTEEMKKWLTRNIDCDHWLYYKRKGRRVDFACSACGYSGTAITEAVILEDNARLQFDEVPEHNCYNHCPKCGAGVHAKAAGRTKGVFEKRDYRYIMQVAGEDVVVRYFEPVKYIEGDCGHAEEETEIQEIARQWIIGNKLQIDYQKYNCWDGESYWDDCNLSGLSNITLKEGKTYRGNFDELQGTRFQYCMLEKMYTQNEYMSVVEYLRAYNKFPQLEMLIKLGMTKLANQIVERYVWKISINPSGKTIKQIFGITKKKFENLKEKNGGLDLLNTYQMEQKFNLKMSEEQVEAMTACDAREDQYETILNHGTFEKVYNYVKKQAGVESVKYPRGKERFKNIMLRYIDYIKACEVNERPMTDSHEIYPANVTEAHNRELMLQKEKEKEKEIKEKNKANPNIKKDAAEYNKRYRYEDDTYVIRAPKDAGEIFMEGLLLNHCVGPIQGNIHPKGYA